MALYEDVFPEWVDEGELVVRGRSMPIHSTVSRHNQVSQPVQDLRMNSLKRSRTYNAPVATSKSVNYKTVNRSITLSGREFIRDVVSTGAAFVSTHTLLRPTDTGLFSWLAAIAKKFEEYKFSTLKFTYEPQVPSSTAGQVGLYFDGDPTHAAPATWNSFINTGANSHGSVWSPQQLNVPRWLFASRASYYTRNEFEDVNRGSPIDSKLDPLEYFAGLFGYVTEGAAALTLGKLYLEYTLTLKTQNVEGDTIKTDTGLIATTEDVVNSGVGYFQRLSSFPAAINRFVFGGPVDYTFAAICGNKYFNRETVAGVLCSVATNDCMLLMITRTTAGNPATVKPQAAVVLAGVLTYSDANGTTTYASHGVGALPIITNEAPANDVTGCWQLRISRGAIFAVTSDQIPTYSHLCFAPFGYGMVIKP